MDLVGTEEITNLRLHVWEFKLQITMFCVHNVSLFTQYLLSKQKNTLNMAKSRFHFMQTWKS